MLRTLLLAITLLAAPAFAADDPYVRLYAKTGKFDNIRDDVEMAIAARGLQISHRQLIGEMLDRTAQDVGATRQVYARAETLQFCSASLSRKTMEADPANIAFCPYIIVIYALPGDPGRVQVGFRRPPASGSPASSAALQEVETLLDSIVREALGLPATTGAKGAPQ
jgi:hypothetical protein